MNLKKISCLFFSCITMLQAEVYVTIEEQSLHLLEKSGYKFTRSFRERSGVSVVKMPEDRLGFLSGMLHQKRRACGGFATYETEREAVQHLNQLQEMNALREVSDIDYTLSAKDELPALVDQVDAQRIEKTIRHLSSYHNRYYTADTGVESMIWIKNTWKDLSKNRSDVLVEEFKHRWKQPSLILTIEGQTKKNEVVILGGHGDSISGMILSSFRRAPGADDNASGISTLTEILKILMDNNFKPERTVKFMAYAAEEVGLRGSKDIAKKFAMDKVDVKGVIQLDMTNFNGSEKKIYMMDDYTNKKQNEFLGNLIDQYVGVSWGYSTCGYACSDHASWHGQGFAASMPSESTYKEMNQALHTSGDTIEKSGGTAEHAAIFAKLGVAYAVEMAN